jgi:diacylglycerol kinase
MKKLLLGFPAAWNGIRKAMGGRNIRIQLGAAMLVVALGVYADLSAGDWSLIALAIGLVLTAELANTAMETIVDLLSPRQHPLAEKAKDIAAGAVLAAAVTAVVIGVLVFSKYFWAQ